MPETAQNGMNKYLRLLYHKQGKASTRETVCEMISGKDKKGKLYFLSML